MKSYTFDNEKNEQLNNNQNMETLQYAYQNDNLVIYLFEPNLALWTHSFCVFKPWPKTESNKRTQKL